MLTSRDGNSWPDTKKAVPKVAFTHGTKSFEKDVTWYPNEKNYLATIADEHYYRDNEYLLENADRYNYYYRPYENGISGRKPGIQSIRR